MSASEYQKRQEGNAVVFSVVPAPQKRFMFIVIMGGLMLLLGLSSSSEHLLGLIGIAGGGAARVVGLDPRPSAGRVSQPKHFPRRHGRIHTKQRENLRPRGHSPPDRQERPD